MPQLFLSNLLSWSLQVFAIAALGAMLPLLFRLRHPATQLFYCHAILVACLALPFLQPWQHPMVQIARATPAVAGPVAPLIERGATRGTVAKAPPTTAAEPNPTVETATEVAATSNAFKQWIAGWSPSNFIVGVLLTGIALRFGWLLLGLWRIRNYRIGATPLYPIPDSVSAAASITHANALFCLSPDVSGPVTLGWLTPVVLLPESFLEMEEEAQCAVACHELLHVRRHDWLITLGEELIGALLWFNPAIWMLLSQTRLTREQLVDAEVVKLTSAREPYIDALLAIAKGGTMLDLAPAPLFLRRRHLTQRMHALLKEVSISKFRLLSSYGSIAAVLGVAVWFTLVSFPLVGDSRYEVAAAETTNAIQPPDRQEPVKIAQAQPPSKAGTATVSNPQTVITISPPLDVHEPITGKAQAADTPEQRAAALALLERAKQNSKLHMLKTPPFRLTAYFQAWGNLSFTGSGQMTEDWSSGDNWVWKASLGAYTQTQAGFQGRIVELSAHPLTPLRVHMLRNAIFWAVRNTPSNTEIRTAPFQWNGKPGTCVLLAAPLSRVRFKPDLAEGRRWTEEEYCFDNASGLLEIHSFVPGYYVVYEYSKNRVFNGLTQADRITIYSNGPEVLDSELAFEDLNNLNPNASTPANAPPGVTYAAQRRKPLIMPSVGGNAIVHANLDPAGRLLDAELVTASDASAGEKALLAIKSGAYSIEPARSKFGTATQLDLFFDIRTEQ